MNLSGSAASVLGVQTPRLSSFTTGVKSLGEDASIHAEAAGLRLFEWQDFVLDGSMQVEANDKWCARDVTLIVSRQNGKGAILTARCIYGLFVLGERIIHTAHEYKTASDAYYRIKGYIESRPELKAQVKRWSSQYGLESIELHNGAKLKFLARTRGSGRGLTCDLLIIDEAYELTDPHVRALLPTQMTSGNPQTWYTSSAVDRDEHPNGVVLSAQRDRGLACDPRMAFFEWSADETFDRSDVHTWAIANPSLGYLIDVQTMADAYAGLSTRAFDVENLSIGYWYEAESDSAVIDREVWAELSGPVKLTGSRVIAVDMDPARRWCSIAAAQWTTDGRTHVEVGYHIAPSPEVLRTLTELVSRWDPAALIIDRQSPAMSLVPDLVNAGIDPVTTTAAQMGQACGGFYTDTVNGLVSHTGDPLLVDALAGASQREMTGGMWAWDRRGSGAIAPLVAVTLAHWGLVTFGAKPKRKSASATYSTIPASERTDSSSFLSVGF